jgi:hypothetical protein
MAFVFLVMATANVYDHKQPIPLQAFNDRKEADRWLEKLIDYHLAPPELPFDQDSDDAWKDYHARLDAWRHGHPAGNAASHYQHFGIYDVPLGV